MAKGVVSPLISSVINDLILIFQTASLLTCVAAKHDIYSAGPSITVSLQSILKLCKVNYFSTEEGKATYKGV